MQEGGCRRSSDRAVLIWSRGASEAGPSRLGGWDAGDHARIRNAIMSAKSQDEWCDDIAWLYGGTGLGS